MALIPFPSLSVLGPSSVAWTLVNNTQVAVSPLSGAVQTQGLPGARWKCAISYPPLQAADAALLRAWLLKMEGMANRVDLWPMDNQGPRGTALANGYVQSGYVMPGYVAASAYVNGAGQTGSTLSTRNWQPGATLRAGDFISFNRQLCAVGEDCVANASGVMAIPVEPPIRTSPADGTEVMTNRPRVRMMLSSADTGWRVPQFAGIVEFSFELIEAFT